MVTKRNDTKTYSWKIFTRALPCFTELRELWYPNGNKIIPDDIYDLLTPIALAHWICGDGYWAKSGVALCTESFNTKDTVRLLNVLVIKYRLECTLQQRGTGSRIYIRGKSRALLCNIVKPHMHDSMLYKLGE